MYGDPLNGVFGSALGGYGNAQNAFHNEMARQRALQVYNAGMVQLSMAGLRDNHRPRNPRTYGEPHRLSTYG